MDNDDDQVLLARIRCGDRAAFSELVVRYQRPIYNAAFWILHRPEDANDVTQTVFLRVVERLDDYDPQYKFFSWLYRITVNESLNVLRHNGREEALDEELDIPDAGGIDPESQFGQDELAIRMRRSLMRMSAIDRVVLTLRHFSECSYHEIGQILDVDEKIVKSRLFEARKRLRELLDDLLDDIRPH